MVARSNLNRIKGILSAKQGAGIPKLEQGAQMTQSTGGAKFKKQKAGTIIYSNDGANWFTDENLQQPHVGGIDGFIDVTTDIATPALAIPGDLNVTPTTAVEKAADLATKTEAHKDENIASYIAASVILPEVEIVATKPKSPNEGVDLKAENTSVGMHVDTDVDGSEDDDSGRDDTGSNNNSAKFGKYAQASSQILKGVGDVFGAQQATTDSNLTKTTDQIYNVAADAIKQAGPVGQYVGTAMQFAGAAGNIIQALGGGTDQMTKTDQWMDSSLFSWNIGMLNGFGGKRANSFAADETTIRNVGGSYGGTVADIEDAQAKAGKKYGLFSSGSRKRANRAIAAAQAKQNIMADISEDAMDRRSIVQSMGEQAGLAYSLMTNGGYNQKYTYAAKHGGLLEWNPVITLEWEPQVELNWKLPEFKEGGNIDINKELEWIPELQKGDKTRTLEQLFEYAKKENPRFIQRLSENPRGIDFIDENGEQANGSHLLSYSTDNEGNAIVFPQIQEMEDGSLHYFEDWKDAYDRAVKNKNILKMSQKEADLFFAEDPEYHTAYKRGWPKMFKNYSQKVELKEYPQEYIDFKNSLPDNQKNTPESEYRTYLYWQLWGKPKDFQYTLEHPNEDGDYMYNWDESDKSYHGSSIAWGKDGVGYFIKPKHHPTLKYELDYYNQGIITQEGGGQRRPYTDERKAWEDFRRNYTLEEDGNFYKYVPIKQSESFKAGGTLKDALEIPEIEETTQKNVIPEGALHKNKHHMEHAEGLTKKGIPVIDEDGEQQAEIEHSEIIFTLEVTKKLEEYYDIFYSEESSNKEKEQAALDAGKLLVYQILENTEDRTGLIESCKKGGSITLKKSTDDLIEEALDWMPTLMIVEEVIEEVKQEEKPKKKSEKDQMKEAIKEVLIELLIK